MAKFSYKDGCLLCNQCGQLYEPAPQEGSGKFECPCGNADTLDAIHEIIWLYNPGAEPSSTPSATRPEPAGLPAEKADGPQNDEN